VAWRWRLLFLRAQIDATLVANGHHMWGPVLCKAFDELRTIQHVENSTSCGVPHVPCTKPPPTPPTPPPAPAATKCPDRAFSKVVPWVRAVNTSNTYGQIVEGKPTPGLPFLGLFGTEGGCKSACEAFSNCTQYSWAGIVNGSAIYSPWNRHCYGRCDTVWELHATAHGGVAGVSARRVVPGVHASG
jgi:hypothetical protein